MQKFIREVIAELAAKEHRAAKPQPGSTQGVSGPLARGFAGFATPGSFRSFAAVFFVLGDPALWSHPLAHFYRSLTYSVHYSQSDPTVLRKDYPFWQPLAWLALSIPQQPPQLTPFFTTSGNFLLAVDSLFLPFALLGWRRMSKAHPLFGWWLVVGLAFLLAWNTKWPQYILLMLVPYCLSAAYGVGLVVQFLNSAVLRWKSRLRTQ